MTNKQSGHKEDKPTAIAERERKAQMDNAILSVMHLRRWYSNGQLADATHINVNRVRRAMKGHARRASPGRPLDMASTRERGNSVACNHNANLMLPVLAEQSPPRGYVGIRGRRRMGFPLSVKHVIPSKPRGQGSVLAA
jgi:hypothetical protein